MADTQEFLDEVLGIFMGEIGLTRSRVEHGYIKPAEAYTENEKTKGKVQQAILQHFQQEQEKAVDELRKIHKIQRDCGSLEDQYMLGLYNGLEMALSIAEDREPVFEPGKKKEPTYTQSEVDRLIREAREREAYWSLANLELIKGGTFNEGMVYKNQLDRLKVISEELSKQEEGSK